MLSRDIKNSATSETIDPVNCQCHVNVLVRLLFRFSQAPADGRTVRFLIGSLQLLNAYRLVEYL